MVSSPSRTFCRDSLPQRSRTLSGLKAWPSLRVPCSVSPRRSKLFWLTLTIDGRRTLKHPARDVLGAANELVSAGLIKDYALGGALAAIYYTEPFTTYYADIIFIPTDETLTAAIPAIYSHVQSKGWRVEREHMLIKDFPIQFLAARGLTEEAVRKAASIEYEGVPGRSRGIIGEFSRAWNAVPQTGNRRLRRLLVYLANCQGSQTDPNF
jgi:hypothetical protein